MMLFEHQKKKICVVLESVRVPAQWANSIKLKTTYLWSVENVSKTVVIRKINYNFSYRADRLGY